MSDPSRRGFIQQSVSGLAMLLSSQSPALPGFYSGKKLKIVCLGAHPDDPESGCGGTLAKFAAEGHEVLIIYLTRGEAGIAGKSHKESADIRTNEAIASCKILKAAAFFAGQVDGDTIVNTEWIDKVTRMLDDAKPDIVFTHWPLDTHKDHQAASLLAIQAWLRVQHKFELYFFEVCTGEQTMGFHPTDFLDISEVQEQKRRAVFCHTSQDPESIYNCGHAAMESFRGRELGVKAAEGFIHMTGQGKGTLPA